MAEALAFQRGRKLRIGEALIALGRTDEGAVARALAKQAGLSFVDLTRGSAPRALVDKVPAALALEAVALPVAERGDELVVAIDDPGRALVAIDTLRFVLNRDIRCAVAAPTALRRALEASYGRAPAAVASRDAPKDGGASTLKGDEGDDAPIVRLVQRMVEDALAQGASDIHVEPFGGRLRIRFRIDGILREAASHPSHLHGPMLARLKVLASMDIAEKRKPQDGRIALRVAGRDIDIRASILPASHGETIVLRLLDRQKGLLPLRELGLDGEDHEWFRRVLRHPNGIVLVTGPTGSGKTTTLYAALSELNRPDVKIVTAEDPVEYHLAGINQCQVRPKVGLDFARILRAMLRQAPNVILVGEIRDLETAEIAIQAALTGHLVFSTLHTNDSVSALTRLIDLGVKPFLVAAAVRAVIAQRLVRTLCADCKERGAPTPSEARLLGLAQPAQAGVAIARPRGCQRCGYSGFRGRKAIFERLEIDETLREMIFRNEPITKVRDYARRAAGLTTLYGDGVRKVLAGETSVAEILRVASAIAEVEEKLDAEVESLVLPESDGGPPT